MKSSDIVTKKYEGYKQELSDICERMTEENEQELAREAFKCIYLNQVVVQVLCMLRDHMDACDEYAWVDKSNKNLRDFDSLLIHLMNIEDLFRKYPKSQRVPITIETLGLLLEYAGALKEIRRQFNIEEPEEGLELEYIVRQITK